MDNAANDFANMRGHIVIGGKHGAHFIVWVVNFELVREIAIANIFQMLT